MCTLLKSVYLFKHPEFITASDIMDVMNNWDDYTPVRASESSMNGVWWDISYVVSIGVIILFALIFVQIIIDILYIVVPPLRSKLFDESPVSVGDSGDEKYKKPIISDDLRHLLRDNEKRKNLLKNYLKVRSVGLILLVVVVMLLVTSTIFMQTGFNIGYCFLKMFGIG